MCIRDRIWSVDHKGSPALAAEGPEREQAIASFVFDTCRAESNWNMENFIADQVELIRNQVGGRKVLLALSGGVDSSVVAALLLSLIHIFISICTNVKDEWE